MAAKLLVFHRRHLDVDIDTVEQWAGDLAHVALDLRSRTPAFLGSISVETAGAGVHRAHQHQVRRKGEGHVCTGEGDAALFKRLTQKLQNIAIEFGQFIEEQNPIVGEAYFAGTRSTAPATNQTSVAHRMVRRPERACFEQAFTLSQHTGDAVDLRCF